MIKDKYTKLNISRQRKWQLRHKEQQKINHRIYMRANWRKYESQVKVV